MLKVKDVKVLKTFNPSGQKQVYLVNIKSMGLESVIMKIGKASSLAALLRVEREVAIQKDMHSNYFPKNFSFELDSDGNYVILEEYINAPQLRECMIQFDTEEKIKNFISELIKGCSLLWDQRIVHRDLKPENILVLQSTPVIIDLGIARALNESTITHHLQKRGPCTPRYASPEQLNNVTSRIDYRTDLFQIGIIIGELFLKNHPYDPTIVGTGMSIVENIENNNYVLDHNEKRMSQELKEVTEKLLEPKQYNRYRNYNKCLSDLGG